jgi:hypothetical protein
VADKPKTIADLGRHHEAEHKQVTVGKSLTSDAKPIDLRIAELERKRKEEEALLEKGGYDYDGREQWEQVMRNVGRM